MAPIPGAMVPSMMDSGMLIRKKDKEPLPGMMVVAILVAGKPICARVPALLSIPMATST